MNTSGERSPIELMSVPPHDSDTLSFSRFGKLLSSACVIVDIGQLIISNSVVSDASCSSAMVVMSPSFSQLKKPD